MQISRTIFRDVLSLTNSVSGASLEDVGKFADSVRSSPPTSPLLSPPPPAAENFEFGYAVKDDVKGDDFSHLVSLQIRMMIKFDYCAFPDLEMGHGFYKITRDEQGENIYTLNRV